MDRPPRRPLTVEEAKNRLRRTMDEGLPGGYVRRHPYTTLMLAVAVGYLLGRHPEGHKLAELVVKRAF